jgi:transcriptional regulator with XRE-family HTH domain
MSPGVQGALTVNVRCAYKSLMNDAVTSLDKWASERSLKDAELAKMIGVSRVHAFRLRRGDYRPSVKTAKRIEEVTGISAASLVMGDAA